MAGVSKAEWPTPEGREVFALRDRDGGFLSLRREQVIGAAAVAAAATIITVVLLNSNNGSHHTEAKPTPTPSSTHNVAPATPDLEKFTIVIRGKTLSCVINPQTYTILPGDNIYTVTKTHQLPAEQSLLPEVFAATVEVNQEHKLVGANPNLIHPGQPLMLFEHCTSTG